MLLSLSIIPISATMAMSSCAHPLEMTGMSGERSWQFTEWVIHSIYLIIEFIHHWNKLLMSMGHKYLHILCPFGEIYPHSSFPDIFLTNFPNTLFLSPLSSSQSIGYSPWINEQPHIWPFFLPDKICMTMCTAWSSGDDSFAAVSFRIVSERGCDALCLSIFGQYLSNVQNHQ